MRTLSLDLRERILISYDKEEGTREEIADRYRVSLGMVKKLLQQRRRTGEIGSRHHRSGRKPMILAAHQRQMRVLLGQKPDLTLKELRAAVELECSLPAIHYALEKMGLTYKKRRSGPASKTAPTLTPQETLRGGQVRIWVPARITCPVCRGRGGMGGYECWRCAGQGALNTELPVEVEYPPGTRGSVARLPLTGFGIHNFYLTVHFRVL